MRAARLAGPRRFEFVEVPRPVPGEGQALVRLQYLSVCGSDMRTYEHVFPEEHYPLETGLPCHECLGVVEESRCDAFPVGQRAIVLPTPHVGLAEYILGDPSRLVPIPEEGDPAVWLMCQPVGTALHACLRMGSVLGKRVAIVGQGPIGLSFTYLLARQGARQVIVTDMLDYRLRIAKGLGATHTINPARQDVAQAIAAATGHSMADVVVEAVGRPETVNQAFQIVRQEGLIVLFGLPHPPTTFPVDYDALTRRTPMVQVTVSSRTPHHAQDIKTCVDLAAEGRLDASFLESLITHRLAFDDVQLAFDLYSEKRHASLKVVMKV